jgi:hypothetical protein
MAHIWWRRTLDTVFERMLLATANACVAQKSSKEICHVQRIPMSWGTGDLHANIPVRLSPDRKQGIVRTI